ncbi:MAG: GNAT family N-acetyltransferase [Gemmatimonadota bacterium]
MAIEIRILQQGDRAVLNRVAAGVFDNPVDARLADEFLGDPRHHIVVAIEDGVVVGFASGVHYVHPDKAPELFINEVGVAPSHHRQGLGKAVVTSLLEIGRHLGCREAWVLTDRENAAGMALYASAGGEEAIDPSIMFNFPLNR